LKVHLEKQNIYSRTINYYKEKYLIQNFEVIGLLIGARGTIPKFLADFWKKIQLGK